MRFALPLIFNFFTMLGEKNTAFFQALGPVGNLAFIGPVFNKFFYPICMPCIALLVGSNLYNRILKCMHLE